MEEAERRILGLVEQGKISSTEADELIEAVRNSISARTARSEPGHGIRIQADRPGHVLSFITTSARWLATAWASVALAVRWPLGWWRAERPIRRRHP